MRERLAPARTHPLCSALRQRVDHYLDNPGVSRNDATCGVVRSHGVRDPNGPGDPRALALVIRSRALAMLGRAFERWSQLPEISRTILENDALAAQARLPCAWVTVWVTSSLTGAAS